MSSKASSTAQSTVSKKGLQIAVIGAGVIGCSVAYLLSEKLKNGAAITVFSDKFSPHTTSDKAGALLAPFDLDTAQLDPRERRWVQQTMDHMTKLYQSPIGGRTGVTLVHGYFAMEGLTRPPWWSESMFGFHQVSEVDRRRLNIPDDAAYLKVFSFSTYAVNCREYLPWLMESFKTNGGLVEQHYISNFSDLDSFDIIINCTGLGAHQLANDSAVYPIRGDAVEVKAPWLQEFYFFIKEKSYTYMFPRSNSVLLGGTGVDSWSEEVDETACAAIIDRCSTIVPSLKQSVVLNKWAGLRPIRHEVKLDIENDGSTAIIHCYGHGGKGITYSWGCAEDVYAIVHSFITKNAKL